ncbi:hypothetical protein ABGB12_01715 [Actinocorallia sp. B10E7]|uniref:hypothetical protein n=1 Tax=Actinocorallia sp. B10E7 TaxID=3153558 RepID=UPI00325CFA87
MCVGALAGAAGLGAAAVACGRRRSERVPSLGRWIAGAGSGCVKDLAVHLGGEYVENAPNAGIVPTLDVLEGPGCIPDRVDPLVREFYEHTGRFAFDVEPRWRPGTRLGNLLYRVLVARPLSRADVPMNQREAQRGVRGRIHTVNLPDHQLRGWLRAHSDTGEPFHVGIYTTYRQSGRGYVGVGFPLPRGAFTATLVPLTREDGGLTLTSESALAHPGHHLTYEDPGTGGLITKPVKRLSERLDVYVRNGGLEADHFFEFFGVPFLHLHYRMRRK